MWQWLKKSWKWIVGIVAVVASVLVLAKVAQAVIDAVSIKSNYRAVQGRPGSIQIQTHDEWVEVKLPDGVSVSQVVSAGISDQGKWAVEVIHGKTDRRGDASIGRDGGMEL